MLQRLSTLFIFSTLYFVGVAQISGFIHIDQFGYHSEMSKVAVISDPQNGYNSADAFAPGSTMQVVRLSDGQVVFTGSPIIWNSGATHAQSGDRGWWFNFSSVTTPGTYRIVDPSSGQASGPFEIADDLYAPILKAATRMFYYNRCNDDKPAAYAGANWSDGMNFLNPGQDVNCRFIYTPDDASSARDLSGGWFDAGDYNKYIPFTENTLHDLLWAYEENPQAFSDETGILESGNGIPDILDEIKWELDWMLKMTNEDGSCQIKLGSPNYSTNVSSPPSANTDPRYYGPICTSASVTIASVFSHAARVYDQVGGFASYAQTLENEAVTAWAYVQPFIADNTLETDCDDGSIIAGDADLNVEEQIDRALTAAIYLFDITGESTYEQFILERYQNTEQLGGYWGVNKLTLADALLDYAQMPEADPAASQAIIESIATEVTNNWNGFFGFGDLDLYRAYAPDWTYDWGSNRAKSSYGNLNMMLVSKGICPDATESYIKQSAQQMHYIHGVNPQGLVYLSNMYALGGDRCVNEIYHGWFDDGTIYDNALTSPSGPAPGFLVGGPNQYFSVPSISPPSGQPIMKAYKDWNTGFPESSWEISEPAIYYQAAYVRLLANFVNAPTQDGCPEDLNADGEVDINDFLIYNSAFGESCTGCVGDIDGSGVVDVNDFIMLNSAFGGVCE